MAQLLAWLERQPPRPYPHDSRLLLRTICLARTMNWPGLTERFEAGLRAKTPYSWHGRSFLRPDSKSKRRGLKNPTPQRQGPPPRASWVKKSHFKRNFGIFLGVIFLVVLGFYALSQQPGSAGQFVQAATDGWKTVPLTDARTGQTFTLGQFAGKVVVLEAMATWCGNCRLQGVELRKVVQSIAGNGQVVVVTVDVDPNESLALLRQYVEQNNFGSLDSTPQWYYAADATGHEAQLLKAIVGNVNPVSFVQTFITETPTYIIPKEQGNTFSVLTHSTILLYNPANDIIAAVDRALKA